MGNFDSEREKKEIEHRRRIKALLAHSSNLLKSRVLRVRERFWVPESGENILKGDILRLSNKAVLDPSVMSFYAHFEYIFVTGIEDTNGKTWIRGLWNFGYGESGGAVGIEICPAQRNHIEIHILSRDHSDIRNAFLTYYDCKHLYGGN